MDTEIDSTLQIIKEYIVDSSQKTHKMLIDNLSSLTIYLDRDQIEVGFGEEEKRPVEPDLRHRSQSD